MVDPQDADAARLTTEQHAPSREKTDRTEPEMVMADETLTTAQKRRFLEDWKKRLGAQENRTGDEETLVARISAALERVSF